MLVEWDEKAVQAAAKSLADAGHKTLAVVCDVSDDVQVEAMGKKTVAAFGPAGCGSVDGGYVMR